MNKRCIKAICTPLPLSVCVTCISGLYGICGFLFYFHCTCTFDTCLLKINQSIIFVCSIMQGVEAATDYLSQGGGDGWSTDWRWLGCMYR